MAGKRVLVLGKPMNSIKSPIEILRERLDRAHPLSDGAWNACMGHLQTHNWRPRQEIFAAGDQDRSVYFIVDGIARYYYIDADGQERNKSITGAGGALCSMDAAINGNPSPFFAEAITELQTVAIDYAKLLELSDAFGEWSIVMRRLLERLILKKERREFDFLMLSARQRYEKFLAEFGNDATRIPLRQVAMYLGITDVALSRIRRDMGMTGT